MKRARIPVSVITGFLGSGKTTLLQRLLNSPAAVATAVLINELGEVAIDHHLVRHIEENIVVLASGCLCCAVRDDLGKALRDLVAKRERGEIAFERIVIETTGLADPVPILHTLMTDPVVDSTLRLAGVVTTVDAVNVDLHLARQAESVKQLVLADHIVVTKTDLPEAVETETLIARLRSINPGARVSFAADPDFSPQGILAEERFDPSEFDTRVLARLPESERLALGRDAIAGPHRHDDAVSASCLVFDEPLEWNGFAVWLTMLLHRHGTDVLRVKGLLDLGGEGPVAIHGVQHLVHPPVHLDAWRDDDRRSRLVVICRGISGRSLKNSLLAFSRAARAMARAPAAPRAVVAAGTQIGGRPVRRPSGLAWMK